jgi:glyoxylase-like metal-dependent hydrolase (beta-lactamase superfamily II)
MKPIRSLAAFLLLAAAPAVALATQPFPFSFTTQKIAEGVHVFIEPPGTAIVSGNSLVVEGEDGVLVMDTGHHPTLTRQMIAEIRRITAKPVKYVVNTHWHNDHVAGNWLYAEAFPNAKFIAHAFTARMLESDVRPYLGAPCQALIRTQVKLLRDLLDKGVGSDGTALTPERRARIEKVLVEGKVADGECAEFRHRGADITFTEKLSLQLGRREVEVLWLGRANTGGDAIVVVPDAKIVAVGDILVHPFPFATQPYITEWAAVLRKIEAMDAAVLVPGHGPVFRDKKYLVDVAELMESISRQVKNAYQPGMSVEEVRKLVNLDAFRERIAGKDPRLILNFNAMIVQSAVNRAYQEVRRAFEPEAMPKG